MASSTINGTPGAAYNGATVSAILLTNGRPNGVIQTSDIVANGAFSLKVPAGSFQLKLVLNSNQLADRAGQDVSNTLTLNTVTTDGVSTYQI